jgi:preprotein translocase subunit SecA
VVAVVRFEEWSRVVRLARQARLELAAVDGVALAGRRLQLGEQVGAGTGSDAVVAAALATALEAVHRVTGVELSDDHLAAAAASHAGYVVQVRDRFGLLMVPAVTAYLCVIFGEHVHVMTVSGRGATARVRELQAVYELLDLTVRALNPPAVFEDRRPAYQNDVVYGDYREFGFDYLSDNLARKASERNQRGHDRAILDEADWILIDQARVLLTITAPAEPDVESYRRAAEAASSLQDRIHYVLDERTGEVAVTPAGTGLATAALDADLTQPTHAADLRRLHDAIRAKDWYRAGIDYTVSGDRVFVDPGSGQLRDDPQLDKGSQQALEAHLNLPITEERMQLGRIHVIEYLKRYARLSGVSTVADLATDEFQALYGLGVASRTADCSDHALPDRLFSSGATRESALAAVARGVNTDGHRLLIGAPTTEDTARVSQSLNHHEVRHTILGPAGTEPTPAEPVLVVAAKEARDLDLLFDSAFTGWAGEGFAVVGAGRSRFRRMDAWLASLAGDGDRDRAARTQFFLASEDPLLRPLQSKLSERLSTWLRNRGEGTTVNIRYARRVREAQQEATRRELRATMRAVRFGRAEATQREQVYAIRNRPINGEDLRDTITEVLAAVAASYVETYRSAPDLTRALARLYPSRLTTADLSQSGNAAKLERIITADLNAAHTVREEEFSPAVTRRLERLVIRTVWDMRWRDHLARLDAARDAIANAYTNFDEILTTYHASAEDLFQELQRNANRDIVGYLLRAEISTA